MHELIKVRVYVQESVTYSWHSDAAENAGHADCVIDPAETLVFATVTKLVTPDSPELPQDISECMYAVHKPAGLFSI